MLVRLILHDRPRRPMSLRRFDPKLDDVRSIFMEVCRRARARAAFDVSGFGQEKWPVDTATDLPVLLEQLPAALHALQRDQDFEIDFYEQGIERKLRFHREGRDYTVSCDSRTRWRAMPATERVRLEDLVEMLESVMRTFLELLKAVAPGLERHDWIVDWSAVLPKEAAVRPRLN